QSVARCPETQCLAIGILVAGHADLKTVDHLAEIGALRGGVERLQRRGNIGERFLGRLARFLLVPSQQLVDVEACKHQVLSTLIAKYLDTAVARLGSRGDECIEILLQAGAQWIELGFDKLHALARLNYNMIEILQ